MAHHQRWVIHPTREMHRVANKMTVAHTILTYEAQQVSLLTVIYCTMRSQL